ncbi:hypothetical protein [Modicisalibacter ilicicola]|uniref:hypothetical protein n=1 Tax=Modicisalibacter ilicicola TaxID=480814 RepID=UPI001587AA03|nr:hypothetical protein [Halomonas ilicicola]
MASSPSVGQAVEAPSWRRKSSPARSSRPLRVAGKLIASYWLGEVYAPHFDQLTLRE